MLKNQRLSGIDMCRGIAIFAVILVHSGDKTWGVSVDALAEEFRISFYFAVPFFLATAFYFTLSKDIHSKLTHTIFPRIKRILFPYLVWTGIYMIIRPLFFILAGNTNKIKNYFQDPLGLILFGGSSYQLYFLPLLILGTITLLLIQKYRSPSYKESVFFLLCSFVVNHILDITNNKFKLGPNIAFEQVLNFTNINPTENPVIRVFSVFIALTVVCLPYIYSGILLRKLINKYGLNFLQSWIALVTSLVTFIVVNYFGSKLIPQVFVGPIQGYSLLIIGISSSNKFNLDHRLIKHLGHASLGMYLIHPILMNVVKIVIGHIYPVLLGSVTIKSMLILSSTTFGLSWLVISCILQVNFISKILFGVSMHPKSASSA